MSFDNMIYKQVWKGWNQVTILTKIIPRWCIC